MKRVSTKLELRALASILDGKAGVRNKMLSAVRPDHFGHAPAAEIFDRIHTYIRNNKAIPSARVMAEDPALSEKAKGFLKSGMSTRTAKHPARLQGGNEIPATVEKLDIYRRQRIFYRIAKESAESLAQDNPDHDRLASSIEEGLVNLRSSTGAEMFHAGMGGNDADLFSRITGDETALEIIPTGFPTFDAKTGGFARTNMVFLAANYGGGKSVAGMQIGLNMYRAGYNVLWVSLEMDETEAWERVWSNISGVDHDLIRRHKMLPAQKRTVEKARVDFVRHGERRKCRFSTYHPGFIDPWQLCSEIRGFKFDVVIIDYIGLVKPPPGTPNEERIQLGEIAKIFKILAGKRYLNCVMIVEAQLNDDNRLKYSRAMAEHANNVMWWRRDERAVERGEFLVHQEKARNSALYDMIWKTYFETMTLVDGGPADNSPIDRKGGKSKGHVEVSRVQKEKSAAESSKAGKGKGSKEPPKDATPRRRGVMPELTSM